MRDRTDALGLFPPVFFTSNSFGPRADATWREPSSLLPILCEKRAPRIRSKYSIGGRPPINPLPPPKSLISTVPLAALDRKRIREPVG
jgi:hypothetical protein